MLCCLSLLRFCPPLLSHWSRLLCCPLGSLRWTRCGRLCYLSHSPAQLAPFSLYTPGRPKFSSSTSFPVLLLYSPEFHPLPSHLHPLLSPPSPFINLDALGTSGAAVALPAEWASSLWAHRWGAMQSSMLLGQLPA